MSIRMNYYGTPENDSLLRFHVPLSHFQTYANDMEKHLLSKQSMVDREEDEDFFSNEDDDDDGISEGWTHFIGDRHTFLVQFPSILRSSLLISVYSFLENLLTKLCRELQEKMKLSVKYNSIAGKGIEKAKTYLIEVVGIEFPSNSIEWQLINDYKNIRNCFAHSEGVVKESDNKTRRSVKNLEAVRIMGDSFLGENIVLQRDFIFNFIETLKGFWKGIENQYLELLYPLHYWYKK
jgi:hypothetical protein